VDTNLKMLVAALLNKDYSKRPNIFDVAKIPCIRKHIIQFVEKTNCKLEIKDIFDFEDKPKPTEDINLIIAKDPLLE
jgi:hypothetical protein